MNTINGGYAVRSGAAARLASGNRSYGAVLVFVRELFASCEALDRSGKLKNGFPFDRVGGAEALVQRVYAQNGFDMGRACRGMFFLASSIITPELRARCVSRSEMKHVDTLLWSASWLELISGNADGDWSGMLMDPSPDDYAHVEHAWLDYYADVATKRLGSPGEGEPGPLAELRELGSDPSRLRKRLEAMGKGEARAWVHRLIGVQIDAHRKEIQARERAIEGERRLIATRYRQDGQGLRFATERIEAWRREIARLNGRIHEAKGLHGELDRFDRNLASDIRYAMCFKPR